MDNRFYWKSNKLEFIIGSNFDFKKLFLMYWSSKNCMNHFIYHFDEFAHTALTLLHLDINTKFSLVLISLNFYLAKLLTGNGVCVFYISPPDIRFACYGVMSYGEI